VKASGVHIAVTLCLFFALAKNGNNPELP